MYEQYGNLVVWFLTLATINSCVVAGIMETLKALLDTKKQKNVHMPNYVGLLLTYLSGFVFTFFMNDLPWYLAVLGGFITGCTSVLIYESAIKALKDAIPAIFDKFLK